MSFQGEGQQLALVLREDFTPLSITGSADIAMPIVFVGYGVTAPEANYDDYDGIDVQGKVVLILRGLPRIFDPASPLTGNASSSHVQLTRKVANAAERGAAAVLLCSDAATLRQNASAGGSGRAADDAPLASYDSLMAFNVPGRSPARRIPVVHVHRRAIESLVRQATGEELAD